MTIQTPATRVPLVAVAVFGVAMCLRPAITAVGPVLPLIGDDLGLGEGALGMLGALPLLAFAGVSPLVHRLSRRIGSERAVVAALGVLAVGTIVRSYTGDAGLWIGTLVIGCAIAVGNVLVPTIVKRDYADHVSRATSFYTAFLTLTAGAASALAVPLAEAVDWRFALAVWAILALVVALLWLPRARARFQPVPYHAHHAPARTNIWREPTAWLLTAFMGLQSATFYIMVTWLPTIEVAAGVPAPLAGVHLFIFQGVGILAGLAIPSLMHHPTNQVAAAVTASVPIAVAVLGLLLAPALVLLWVIVAGLGSGAAFVVALALVSLRGRTHDETTRLSGMTQSLGYLLAAAGPVGLGYLAERTGSWQAPLVVLAVLATIQVGVAVAAGVDRRVD